MVIDEQQHELKRRFAESMLREPNAMKAVRSLNLEPSSAVLIVQAWPNDPVVLELQKELLEEHGAKHFLPTREEIAREIHAKAQITNKPDDFVKLMKLYGEYMGYIEKPGVTVNNQTQQIVNVMRVPMAESEKDWEQRAIEQQADVMKRTIESTKHGETK